MTTVFLGFDSRETAEFAVARASLRRHGFGGEVFGLVLPALQDAGLYTRPTEIRDGRLFDVISEHPMATEFAISRFLVPFLMDYGGWALFADSDVLFRANVAELFLAADPAKAIYCVKHRHEPPEGLKMDGQVQTRYRRKNWSSVMLINCRHPANALLTPELVNAVPGRDLHAFSWLSDDLIGELDPAWNFLVGHSDPAIEPKLVHFTDGSPAMAGYEEQPFANEWRHALQSWANHG